MESHYDTAGSWKRGALVHYVSRPGGQRRWETRALCGTRWSRFWRFRDEPVSCQGCVVEAEKRLYQKRPPHRQPPRWAKPLNIGPRSRKSPLAE